MKRFITILSILAALLAASAALGQTKAELKQRFKDRAADLQKQKERGVIGETIEGYVAVVDDDAATQDTRDLLENENKDRRRLYQILADEINEENPDADVKATPGLLAMRSARRAIGRAGPDEWLLVEKDHWIRMRDFPRFEELRKLKTQGKVGETGEGMVEIVKPEDQNDKDIAPLVKEENRAREEEYKALARDENVDVETIVKRMVKRNFDNARIGDYLKDENGWRKK
jgi:uncharacterized protein YdbL (DUF1318 family)